MTMTAEIDNRMFRSENASATLVQGSTGADRLTISGVAEDSTGIEETLSITFVVDNGLTVERRLYAQTGRCNQDICLVGNLVRVFNNQTSRFTTDGNAQEVTIEVDVSRSSYEKGGRITGEFSFNALTMGSDRAIVQSGTFDVNIAE